ncbi:MAG TPA: efflux RND transporter periplasmic adaptor subunit [Candidatus Saccharimonadaceae bacterium]|nr:efflux RND transporter periplasmic adaptor subunit [Candidatus Saccharimonadaceae bacterium]
MNRKGAWIVAGIVIVIVTGGLWWKSHKGAGGAHWRTATVERGTIESRVSATGTIRPVVQVQVGSQVSGVVQSLHADYNQRVKKGELLLQIDPSSFRARAVQSEAAVARAEAALKDAKRQYARAQELIKQNYISQAEVDGAEVTVEQRDADLKQARAQLDAARVDLTNTSIRAPIDGVVISRSVDVGQTVAASLQAPQLFVLGNDLTQMQVETRIDESDIGRIHQGLPVTFNVDAFPDDEFGGKVAQVRLEPITDQGVVTYTTVIETRNPDLKLRPGMTANVSVLVEKRDSVLKVPAAALRFRLPGEGRGAGGGAGGAGGGSRGGRLSANAGAGAPMMAGAVGTGAAEPGARPGAATSGTAGGAARGAGGAGGAGANGGGWRARGAAAGMDTAAIARIRAAVQAGTMTRDEARAQFQKLRGASGGGAGGARGADQGGMAGAAGTRWGGAGSRAVGTGRSGERGAGGAAADAAAYRPGVIYLLRGGKPEPVRVLTGLSDGTTVEVVSRDLQAGDLVITGQDLPVAGNAGLQPPPGLGGPQFRIRGGGGGGGGGRGR